MVSKEEEKDKKDFDKLLENNPEEALKRVRDKNGKILDEVKIGKQDYKVFDVAPGELFNVENSPHIPDTFAAFIINEVSWKKEEKEDWEIKRTNFRDWYFIGKVVFKDLKFSGEADFGGAMFFDETSFIGMKFPGRVVFSGTEDKKIFAKHALTNFSYVKFEKQEQVLIQRANLNKVSFKKTNISEVNFIDVQWGESQNIKWSKNKKINSLKKLLCHKRKILYDEEEARKDKGTVKLVEDLYRLLKVNFETKKDFARTGDFYYGEMEMKRMTEQNIFMKQVTWLYKILSGYGEKPGLAFLWLLLFIGFFASFYLFAGFKLANSNPKDLIAYNWTWNLSNIATIFTCEFLIDFWKALIHCLDVATFQKARMFVVETTIGGFIEIVQTIVISIQTALAALAIKRRFKR